MYTLRVFEDLVIVDAVVTDKKGNPIKNLMPADFTIYEDNVRQKIATFDVEDLFTQEEGDRGTTPPSTPPSAAVVTPSVGPAAGLPGEAFQNRRLIVLFLDLSSMPVEDLVQAQKTVLQFIDKQLTPSDLLSIVVNAATVKMLQDFTNDREVLRQTVQRVHIGDSADLAEAGATNPDTSDTSSEDLSDTFVADETQYNIFNTDRKLSAIETVGKMFREIPQRKFLVHFSSGLSTTGVENQAQLRATIDALNQSNVSLYSVDARGLIAAPPGGDASKGSASGTANYSGKAIRDQYASIANSQETLTTLALDTGGKAIFDTNNLGQVFEAVREDSKSYYVLGYYSSNSRRDGRYRQIKLRVNIPEAHLKYRQGYYAPKSFEQFTKSDKERQLEEAITTERPFSEIPFLVAANFLRVDQRTDFVPVSLKFAAADIPFQQKGKKAQAEFDFIGQVLGPKSRVVNAVRDTIRVDLDAGSFRRMANGDIQYNTGFYLTPGKYDLKFLLRENQTGKLSTFEQALSVPDFGESKLALSSIILSNRLEPANSKANSVRKVGDFGESRQQSRNSTDPLVVDQNRIIPSVARVFVPQDTLYIFFQIYRQPAKGFAPNITASLTFLKNGKVFREASQSQLNEYDEGSNDTLTCNFQVPLAQFSKGEYVLQVKLTDNTSQKDLIQRSNFVIR
ncbi:MAG: hypothetical protein DMG05_13990 [Acidobacteria bacterium]|nr:MAG: hypothetical protein DMG05_13990 [Acidobacteriota bacterium]